MATRHKDIKATLDVGRAAEWNDDHIIDFSDEVDFEYSPLTIPVVNVWDTGQTAGGTAPVVALTDSHTSVYLVTGAATDQTSSMRLEMATTASDITAKEDAPVLTLALWLDSYHTALNVAEFGLIPYATALFTANQDGAYFRISGNILYAVTGNGAAETATDITPALGIPEYGNYKIELADSSAKFYVTDMEAPAATITATLPNNDLTIKISVRSKNNVNTKAYLDGVALKRNRYQG
jgi:hypothetical protein